MKKRIFALAIAVATMLLCTSCSSDTGEVENQGRLNRVKGFEMINGEECLSYDANTKVVYYIFADDFGTQRGFGYMSPYISENGHFCRFIDGEIVEITEN